MGVVGWVAVVGTKDLATSLGLSSGSLISVARYPCTGKPPVPEQNVLEHPALWCRCLYGYCSQPLSAQGGPWVSQKALLH